MKGSLHELRAARAFTLVETLAVVVIVSLAAGATLVRLSAVSDAAALRGAAATALDLDARARLTARAGTPVTLAHTDEGDGLVLRERDTGAVIAALAMPAGTVMDLRGATGESVAVHYDVLGRSRDYVVQIGREGRSSSWRVSGLTGHAVEEGPR